jgi:6-phosphofructokinase 2
LIVTLTLNPAIDRNVTTDRLAFEDRSYILSAHETAGGRGINASRVIHEFGAKTAAIAISGGGTRKRFEALLAKLDFPVHLVRVKNDIRSNLTITDERGLTVKLNEFGPQIDKDELKAIELTVTENLAGADWLMICGSFPPGIPPEFCKELVALAKKHNVKTLLDTDGEALVQGIAGGPTVVAPNQQEAERLLKRALLTRNHCIEALDRLLAMGVESVILSLGSRGAMSAREGHMAEAVPPRVEACCPIGAGDALAAAFVWALNEGHDFFTATRWGVAAGTASALLPGVAFATIAQTKAIFKDVELRQVR